MKNVQEVWLIPAVGVASVKYDDVMFKIQNNVTLCVIILSLGLGGEGREWRVFLQQRL